MLKQKTTSQVETEFPDTAVTTIGNDDSVFTDLAASLAEIRKLDGVRGYILRSDTSAIIDLSEQEKIIDYAILSSQIEESCSEMAKQFNLTDIESVMAEGKTIKVLCMNRSENRVCVFMDKKAPHDSVIKRILQ